MRTFTSDLLVRPLLFCAHGTLFFGIFVFMTSRFGINIIQICQKTVRHLYRTARPCHALLNTAKRQEPSTSAFHCTLPATTLCLCCSAACRNGMEAFVAVENASTATLWCGTRARNLSMVSGSTAGAGGSSSSRSATNCCSNSALSGPECLQQPTGSEAHASGACCVDVPASLDKGMDN